MDSLFIAGLISVVSLFAVYMTMLFAWSLNDKLRHAEARLKECERKYNDLFGVTYKAVLDVPKKLAELKDLLSDIRAEKCKVIEVTGMDSEEYIERLVIALFDIFLSWCVLTMSVETDDDAKYCGDYAAKLVNNILSYAENLKYSDTMNDAIKISIGMK